MVSTHGLFTGDAVKNLNAIEEIDEIIVTNTVPHPPKRRPERLTELSVGPTFGEVIRRNVLGESIGALFEYWREESEF
jgi:ribose-phosphate pyrophosphokinase